MKMRIKNVNNRPITLLIGGRPESPNFYFLVTLPDGTQVWNSSWGVITLTSLSFHRLGIGETLELKKTWDQRGVAGKRVPPGTYHVQGVVRTDIRRYPDQLRTEVKPLVITR